MHSYQSIKLEKIKRQEIKLRSQQRNPVARKPFAADLNISASFNSCLAFMFTLKFLLLYLFIFISAAQPVCAQTMYSIDASNNSSEIKSGHFKMGNPGPEGNKFLINSRYITINNRPVVPVMGELQFSRVPESEWEDRILKMKACGINIVSTYLMWIHHEEIEGQFVWSGNKDLRSFVKLCAKNNMLVYARIGPWAHGEVRNGGTPDWLLKKDFIINRSNDPVYRQYVDRYFAQIGNEMKGLMYKDGGPVVGIQLENEYTRGKEGESHIMWLKNTALKYGMDVPMYSVTGWGNGSVPPNEVIPLWGGYPDEPWDFDLNKITDCGNFQFNAFRNDDKIGTNLEQKKNKYMDYSLDPYFTCEMGVGVQNTYHRRLVIGSIDGAAMINAKIGAGVNLLGYYIFAGGTNPHGILSTMNEEKDEAGNWTQTPVMSYDFQAAIQESGELSPSYYEVKKLNYFLNEFGEQLAPMEPVLNQNKSDFQYAVRAKDNSAFLFGINYCRHNTMKEKKDVRFNIKLKSETVLFPSTPINIADSSIFIFPINFKMNSVLLKYATAQPLCNMGDSTWVFFDALNQSPEFCFEDANIQHIESTNGKINKAGSKYIVTDLKPGLNCSISIIAKNGMRQTILIISKEESLHAWLLSLDNKKQFFISPDNLYVSDDKINIYGFNNNMQLSMLNKSLLATNKYFQKQSTTGLFTNYFFSTEKKELDLQYIEVKSLSGAQWLKTSVKEVDSYNLLYHRLFIKEFSLNNPSKIKSARMIFATGDYCRLQVNGVWMQNQNIDSNKLNTIDLTGYVQKGNNKLLFDFPFEDGNKAFAARVVVEYFNDDEIEFSSDSSWLTSDEYTFPSEFSDYKMKFKAPETVTGKAFGSEAVFPAEWRVDVPCNYLQGLNNVYLSLKYSGNTARLYKDYELVKDNFNSNVSWDIGLRNLGSEIGCRSLKLKIFPFTKQDRILFDIPPAQASTGKAIIDEISFVPEYKIVCN